MRDLLDSNVTVAAVATDVEQLSLEYRKAFRCSVEEALQYVFHVSASDAAQRSARYFEGEIVPSLFTYHRHVLQIASDLSEVADKPLDKEQERRYLAFAGAATDVFGLPHAKSPDEGESFRLKSAL